MKTKFNVIAILFLGVLLGSLITSAYNNQQKADYFENYHTKDITVEPVSLKPIIKHQDNIKDSSETTSVYIQWSADDTAARITVSDNSKNMQIKLTMSVGSAIHEISYRPILYTPNAIEIIPSIPDGIHGTLNLAVYIDDIKASERSIEV